MKKVFITLLSCLFIGVSSDVVGQGMEFFDGTFEEALALAEKEDKAVFVDAYTTWCGPCKRMSKYVFTEANVGTYYNANFINLKLNMEKEEGMKFKLNYPVSAYPTLYYIKPDGEVLYTTKGGRNPEQFIDLGKKALLKYDRTSEFSDLYEEGDRSFETVYNYIKGLKKSGKSCAKVANDYIGTQSNLTSKENLLIIYESMTEMDSRMYDLFDKYKTEILAHVEKEDYDEKVRKVADQTLDRAIEFKESSLLSEAQEKRKSHLPEEAKSWNLESQMKYSSAISDGSGYLKSAKKFEKKFAKDANSKNSLVKEAIVGFQKDEKVMKWAAGVAEKAIELGGLSDYHLTYAYTQYYLGNRDEAKKHAEKAVALAKEQNSNPTSARNLLAKLKG